MYVGLDKILSHSIFECAKIIAGEKGTGRPIKRVSVFDCPYSDKLIEDGIIQEGDLFITCMSQFDYDPESIYMYIDTLIEGRSSGLLILTERFPPLFDNRIKEICNKNNFPVIWIYEDIPYATIIETVNKYISMETINSINALKLDTIRYSNLSTTEKMNIVYSINPGIKKFMRVIEAKGEYNSEIMEMEWHIFYLNHSNDIYVRKNNRMIFILSADSEKELKHHSNATLANFNGILENPLVGCSRIHDRRYIPIALEEATKALETAQALQISTMIYEPMSSLQLILSIKDAPETYDFYNAYVEKIGSNISAENLEEILLTIETYVAKSGNFSETAKALNQHENTIRYRINKAKTALGMEYDNVKFHETIAIASKLRNLIN